MKCAIFNIENAPDFIGHFTCHISYSQYGMVWLWQNIKYFALGKGKPKRRSKVKYKAGQKDPFGSRLRNGKCVTNPMRNTG